MSLRGLAAWPFTLNDPRAEVCRQIRSEGVWGKLPLTVRITGRISLSRRSTPRPGGLTPQKSSSERRTGPRILTTSPAALTPTPAVRIEGQRGDPSQTRSSPQTPAKPMTAEFGCKSANGSGGLTIFLTRLFHLIIDSLIGLGVVQICALWLAGCARQGRRAQPGES